MRTNKPFALFLITCIALAGCGGHTAHPANTVQSNSSFAASNRATSSRASFALPRPPISRRHSPRETFLSTYRNPEHGISFRYPRNYPLQGSSDEELLDAGLPFLKLQEQLDEEQPGATLLATILIPDDAYPNTTFEHGALQLVVNESGTQKTCRDAANPTLTNHAIQTLTAHEIVFRWSEEETDADGNKLRERVYASFVEGTCYEFFLAVVAQDAPDPDGFKRAADLDKIMKQLQEIVKSTQTFPEKTSAPPETTEPIAQRL
jgi:hypothetical protein